MNEKIPSCQNLLNKRNINYWQWINKDRAYMQLKHINPYPANVENMVSPNNDSKRQMGFNWAFKGLKC